MMVLLIVIIVCIVLSLTVFFKVATISVSGDFPYTFEQVLSASNIQKDKNMFRQSMREAEKNIKQSMIFVENVEVKRVLPDSIHITIEQCEPYANIECAEVAAN